MSPTLADVLKALGQMEPEDIHDLFATQGLTGLRGCPDLCVVANYLSIVTGAAISVGTLTAQHMRHADRQLEILPQRVCDFIDAFDRGQYPDLVAPEPVVAEPL